MYILLKFDMQNLVFLTYVFQKLSKKNLFFWGGGGSAPPLERKG